MKEMKGCTLYSQYYCYAAMPGRESPRNKSLSDLSIRPLEVNLRTLTVPIQCGSMGD